MATKKVKPEKRQRKQKIKVDLSVLPQAINTDQEPKLILKQAVVFERRINSSKNEIHVGTIEKFDSKDGTITIWDETAQQWYLLNICQSDHIKVMN